MGGQNPFIGNGNNTDGSQNFGPKLALWGTLVSTLGDAMQTIGSAIAIEESIIAEQQQQQQFENLQNQIDDLKKGQTQSPDLEVFNKLLERMLDVLEAAEDTKNNSYQK